MSDIATAINLCLESHLVLSLVIVETHYNLGSVPSNYRRLQAPHWQSLYGTVLHIYVDSCKQFH